MFTCNSALPTSSTLTVKLKVRKQRIHVQAKLLIQNHTRQPVYDNGNLPRHHHHPVRDHCTQFTSQLQVANKLALPGLPSAGLAGAYPRCPATSTVSSLSQSCLLSNSIRKNLRYMRSVTGKGGLQQQPGTVPTWVPHAITPATATAAATCTAGAVSATVSLPAVVCHAVTASAVYTALIFITMILLPRAEQVRKFLKSFFWFVPLALTYLALLAYSWTPDTLNILLPGSLAEGLSGGFKPQFFPKLEGIAALFSRPATAASLVLHILGINLFLGRSIYLEGAFQGIPTQHSLFLALFFGPLGLLVHWATQALLTSTPKMQPTTLPTNGGGKIIIMPYEEKK